MMKLVDMLVLGTSGAILGGSSPFIRILCTVAALKKQVLVSLLEQKVHIFNLLNTRVGCVAQFG